MASYTFYPNFLIFLHRYICHICDISQLCLQTTSCLSTTSCSTTCCATLTQTCTSGTLPAYLLYNVRCTCTFISISSCAYSCTSTCTCTCACRSPSYYSPGMYPPPPPMSRPVALVRSSEAATTSPPISTSPGEQHQLRYDLMPPILPPGEHGHAEGGFSICLVISDWYYFRNVRWQLLSNLWAVSTLRFVFVSMYPRVLLCWIQFIHGSVLCLVRGSIHCANELLWRHHTATLLSL